MISLIVDSDLIATFMVRDLSCAEIPVVTPSLASIEVVVWVALGGRGSLCGAALGAIVVNAAKTFFTGFYPEAWLFFLGAIFVISTLYLPRGILGALEDAFNQLLRKSSAVVREVPS